MNKKLTFLVIFAALLFSGIFWAFLETRAITTITADFHESKGNTGVVGNVFIPDMDPKDIEKYNGKRVTATGKIQTEKGTCPENNTKEIVQCYEDDRLVMIEVKSIELAQ